MHTGDVCQKRSTFTIFSDEAAAARGASTRSIVPASSWSASEQNWLSLTLTSLEAGFLSLERVLKTECQMAHRVCRNAFSWLVKRVDVTIEEAPSA